MTKDIYITLPHFCMQNYLMVNNKFIMLCRTHHDWFLLDNMKIISLSDAFPYLIWAGNTNSNFGFGMTYKDIRKDNISGVPIRIDCSNTLLKEEYYYDRYCNLVLSENNNGTNYIEVADMNLFEFLVERYPNYRYVLSRQANLFHELSAEIITSVLKLDKFTLVQLPDSLSNVQSIKELTNKNKLEISLNPRCYWCENKENCMLAEQQNQIDYSAKSMDECTKYKNVFNEINLIDKIKKFNEVGINHFKIEHNAFKMDINTNINKYIAFLVDNFINPQYYSDVYKELTFGV